MKSSLNFNIVVLAIASLGAMSGCMSEDSLLKKDSRFYDESSQKTFSLEDHAQLNRLASVLAKETSDITIVENAQVVDLTDIQGDFKALSVKYQIGNRITRMVVPLTEVHKSIHTYYNIPAESCVMKFTGTNAECTYEIIERCKSLTAMEGGSSITFNDKALKSALLKGTESLFYNRTDR